MKTRKMCGFTRVLAGFVILGLLGGCDRSAKNKLIGGSDAASVAAEASAVQTVKDVWTVTGFGSALGAANAAPGHIGVPEGVELPQLPNTAPGLVTEAEALCQSLLSSAGFSGGVPGSDGFYTISRSPGGGFTGIFKIAFLNAANAGVDICLAGASVVGFGLKMTGFVGFGNSLNLDLTFTNVSTSPTLNGTVSGSSSGVLYNMQFKDCVYAIKGSATPSSGRWSGSFGSTATGSCLFTINFSATGGSGTMICGTGTNYRITISRAGTLSISS